MRAFYTWAVLGLTLAVSPLTGFGPATLHLKVKSEKGDQLVILIDDEDFYRRTDVPNDGKTLFFDWREVPPGEHTIHLFVYERGRQVDHKTQQVHLESRF